MPKDYTAPGRRAIANVLSKAEARTTLVNDMANSFNRMSTSMELDCMTPAQQQYMKMLAENWLDNILANAKVLDVKTPTDYKL